VLGATALRALSFLSSSAQAPALQSSAPASLFHESSLSLLVQPHTHPTEHLLEKGQHRLKVPSLEVLTLVCQVTDIPASQGGNSVIPA
jgi:hypothetical protein